MFGEVWVGIQRESGGPSYDGASVISGRCSWVQTRVKEVAKCLCLL